MTYETSKRTMMIQQNKSDLTLWERVPCAALSGMVCWACIFPADVLRSKMYAQTLKSEGTTKLTTMEMAWSMYQGAGYSLRPFFRGFWLTVARAGPVASTVLPIYDLSLEQLNKLSF
eukprot:CAMPEP_0118687388 /NCGR_PEP_ID=MMETSP0800-20121206/8353_1 /TAXON_ID=210618 ORGANISM="Striatella unipunctata, Strain CCMP2910" /NCGR_SAMPLE_ID=MMETSP0800 /ASSEMBLY_ACC=CAM_ASM_000638 /LENGTH=116 /DNA_ID=CAMNT_0006584563 /DNA_START=211 /DNA_END=561 /DNA_ORIENTATION=+